jgi:hypothetical protein
MKIIKIAIIESEDFSNRTKPMYKINNDDLNVEVPEVDLVLNGSGKRSTSILEYTNSLVKEFDKYGSWCELESINKTGKK